MALDLRYNSPQTGTSLGASTLFNGNISQMMWATSSAQGQAGTPAGYGFTYDGINRLRSAAYAEGTSYTSGAGKFSTTYSYDANGNMATLTRNLDGNQVDNLGYTYYSGGNRLQAVADNVSNATYKALGYKAASGNYLYDNNGNMTYDISKGFTLTYNSLNLPQLVSMASDYARYTYDAAGTKLAKTVTNGSASTVRTDYSGSFMYENSVLKCIFTPEGRIVPQNNGTAMSYSYEYNLKDHLGNTRVTFTGHANGRPEVNQLTSYDPYGLVTSQTSYYPTGASKNKLLYNGKEIQDDVLAGTKIDWFDYGARMYDAQLGRWFMVDGKAEKYFPISPYNYCLNNPLKYLDPDGRYAASVHYRLTYNAFFSRGYDRATNDKIAHYSGIYADHPPKSAINIDNLGHGTGYGYRDGINYNPTKYSQDENNSVWHGMMTDAEAAGGMTHQQAMQRGLEFGWSNIFSQQTELDFGKLGQGLHALQDAYGHRGASTSEHLGYNISSAKMMLNDMYGDTKEAELITNSAVVVFGLLTNNSRGLTDGMKLDFSCMSKEQLETVSGLFKNAGFKMNASGNNGFYTITKLNDN